VYVCICNQVTDHEIHGAAHLGVSTMDELAETLGVGTCCGRCRECAQQVLCEGVAAVKTVRLQLWLRSKLSKFHPVRRLRHMP
jgi:bacterioferritin-associated ferredoxin